MKKNIKIKEILKYLESIDEIFCFTGNEEDSVNGFSSLAHYVAGSLTWVKAQKSVETCADEKSISLAIVQEGVEVEAINKITSKDSKRIFFNLIERFFVERHLPIAPIGQGTYISPQVKLGTGVTVGHNCTLDGNITVGDNTRIYNNVSIINKVEIGKNCEIQSGVNIGHDGFGYTESEKHVKKMVRHYGGVVIGDDVYIGGNSYIERGTIDNTVISNGVKIDGLCTIGHNSIVGENTILVTGSILYGSSKIGRNVYLASAIIRNQCQVGDGAFIGMGSVVTEDIEGGATVIGVPAKPMRKK